MGRIIGYARVSTTEQNLDLQVDALKKEGCADHDIYIDKDSGAKADRPGLKACLAVLEPGDVFVVWKLDRLGRSMPHLIETITNFQGRGIGFWNLQEAMDTQTSGGRLIFNIFSSLADFERDLILERTQAGLKAARARGRTGGRPKSITPKTIRLIRQAYEDQSNPISDICTTFGISRSTLYRYL